MQGVADLEPADIGFDILGDVVDRTFEVDRMGDDVDGAAALDAGRSVRAHHMQGDADTNGGALAEPHEIDMDREVAYGIKVEVAGDHAVSLAVKLNVID